MELLEVKGLTKRYKGFLLDEYILFYSIGKGKSNQMMAIIRMIPAFIMFFVGNYLSGWIKGWKW